MPPVTQRHVVWIDSNMEVTSPTFVREAIACIHDGLALFAHPRRDCIYEEAEACLGPESRNGKYANQPIREQVAHYRSEGHPEHAGLYACGTIAWDRYDTKRRKVGYQWLAECARWSYQDQLSFPFICRRLGVEPGLFPHPQLERYFCGPGYIGNRWFRIWPHL
jgi:hypothetical protein